MNIRNIMDLAPDALGILPGIQQIVGGAEILIHLACTISALVKTSFHNNAKESNQLQMNRCQTEILTFQKSQNPKHVTYIGKQEQKFNGFAAKAIESHDKFVTESANLNDHIKKLGIGIIRVIPIAGSIYSGIMLYRKIVALKIMLAETSAKPEKTISNPSTQDTSDEAPPLPYRPALKTVSQQQILKTKSELRKSETQKPAVASNPRKTHMVPALKPILDSLNNHIDGSIAAKVANPDTQQQTLTAEEQEINQW